MRNLLRSLFVVILGAAVAAGAGYYWLTQVYANSPAELQQEQVVEIPPGTGGRKISSLLEEKGVLCHADAFRVLSVLEEKNQRFQAGEYLFMPGITPHGVMEKLVKGDVIHHQVTIPEGKTSVEIVALLRDNTVLTGGFQKAAPPEGSLLPETYDFTKGTQRQALIRRMMEAHSRVVTDLWPGRQADLPLTTPHEAIILASIVEKETGKPEERPRIAAVYLNRLKQGMPLQADPTVAYGVYGGQYADKPLTVKDLKTDTPYNTYTRTGLPAGPICHPGRAAIEAVLQPLATQELFFVATGDGGHRFAKTLEEHNQNVAEYRKWKKAVSDKR